MNAYREPDVCNEYPVTPEDFDALMSAIFDLELKMGPLGNEHRRDLYRIRCHVSTLSVHYRHCVARAEERAARAAAKAALEDRGHVAEKHVDEDLETRGRGRR